VPQTALATTLVAALGLPILPVSEYPPRTDLFTWDEEGARARRSAYFDAKVRASGGGGLPLGLAAGTDEALLNTRLNEDVFGTHDTRPGYRFLAAAAAAVGMLGAALAIRRVPTRRVRVETA
jgi:hypothetical protein